MQPATGRGLTWSSSKSRESPFSREINTSPKGRWRTEVHYQDHRLPPERAGPTDLLRFSRVHWAIENRLHYVRGVTFGEDASRIRSGAAPQAMAALRNLIVAVLHRDRLHNRAAGLRQFAWHPDQAAQALGLPCPSLVAAARVA